MGDILQMLRKQGWERMSKLWNPLNGLEWIERSRLIPNDYNPNRVSRQNLELLTTSIFVNGFTLPVVCRPDMTIIDGFHRYTVFGPKWKFVPKFKDEEWHKLGYKFPPISLFEEAGGMIPVVKVSQIDESMYIYGTVTHNRARGTHLLEPMKAIVKRLMDEGKTVQEIGKQLGMKPEEIFRLSDFSKDDFLNMMTKGVADYSKAEFITKI